MAGDKADADWEQFFETVRRHVTESGYHLTYVDDEPPFCYSAGLSATWDHPELLVYGLTMEDATTILVALAQAIREGKRFGHAAVDSDTFDRPITFLEVAQNEYLGRFSVTTEFYEHMDFAALQVVIPDQHGRFPWNDDCAPEVIAAQPLLGQPPV